jgi:RHS repeat-associated protein
VTSGVDETSTDLPSGGGGVRPPGDDFTPNLAMGGASYKVPLTLPAGPGGATPKLDLSYNTGLGSGGFGVGWALSLPYVERKRKAPLRPEAEEAYSVSGAQTLIPVADGSFVPFIGESLQRFHFDGDQWMTQATDLTRMRFGSTPATRIEGSVGGQHRTYRWLLDQITFPNGMNVDIAYRAEGSQRYIASVTWSVFQLDFAWEDRPDPFSAFDAGFEVRTALRCTGMQLHRSGLAVDTLMRSYRLGYTQAPRTEASLLTSVQISGWRDVEGVLQETALRPLTLAYTPFDPARGAFERMRSTTVAPPPLDDTTTLFDYRGTALPGVLRMDGTTATYWENRGGYQWGPPETLAQIPTVSLADPGVHFADLTGTGTADLVVDGGTYFPNDPEHGLQPARTVTLAPTFDFADPASFLIDLDGDRVADLLTFRNGSLIGCLNQDGRSWSEPFVLSTEQIEELDPDSGRVRFADMNGDGNVDMIMLRSRRITYWPYLGSGSWGAPRHMATTPELDLRPGAPQTVLLTDINDDGCADLIVADARSIRIYLNRTGEGFADPIILDRAPLLPPGSTLLADMTGSGTAGLVWTAAPAPGQAPDYWTLDLLGGQQPHLLRVIDNGYGSVTTIDYSTSTRQRTEDLAAGRRWTGFLPLCVPVVTRITKADTVTGFTATTSYRYHDGHYDRFAHEYLGFAQVDTVTAGTETEAALTQRMYFHNRGASARDPQFIAGQGQAHRTEILDADGQVRRVDESTWTATAISALRPAWLAAQTAKTSVRSQDGIDFEHESIAYALDAVGNVVREAREGRWSDDGTEVIDRLVIETAYAALPNGTITSLPCELIKRDGAGRLLQMQRIHYDGDPFVGLPLGQVERGWKTRITEVALTQDQVTAAYGGSEPLLDTMFRRKTDPRFGTVWLRDVTRFRYDDAGNHLEMRNATDCNREFEYDSDRLHPTRMRENGGPWRAFTFDPIAQEIASSEDRNGNILRYEYDGLGTVTAVYRPGARPDRPTEVFVQDRASVPQSRTQHVRVRDDDVEPGSVQRDFYDGGGTVIQRRVGCADGRWAVEKQKLAADGKRVLRERAAYFADGADFEAEPPLDVPSRCVFYDFAGRPIREELFSGAFTLHEYVRNEVRFYDPIAAAKRESDPSTPASRANRLDAWARLVAIVESDDTGEYVQRRYQDPLGRLTSIVDPLGHTVLSTVYDLCGNRIRIDSADCGRSVALFDAGDHEVRRTDGDGQVTFYVRGSCGRIEEVRAQGPAGPVQERHFYDAGWGQNLDGRLARVEGDFGTAEYSYTPDGDPIETRRTYTGHTGIYTVQFAYNAQRKLVSVTYPDGTVVNYQRDVTGLQTAIPGYIDEIAYTAQGARERIRFTNGLETIRAYSPGDELLTGLVTRRLSDDVTYQDLAYQLDTIGQVTAVTDTSTVTGKLRNPQTFAYDRRGRLSHATGRRETDYAFDYRYDALGNITYADESFAETVQYGHDLGDSEHPNRLIKRLSAPSAEYAYDASGRLTADPMLGHLSYDERSRLIGIVKPDGVRLVYVYDHNDRRVATRRIATDGTTTERIEVEGIYLIETSRTVKVIFDEDRRLAIVPSTGDALLHHMDRLGNVNVLTNLGTGAFVAQQEYTPYGQLSAHLTITPAFTLHGAEFGDDTDLVLLGARYYRPVLGRFLTGDLYLAVNQDKIGGFIVAAHLYAYAYANPTNYTDPTGQIVFLLILLIAVVIGAIVGAVGAGMNGVSTWDEFVMWVFAGMVGGALAACGMYFVLGPLLGVCGAAALANFTFWGTVIWGAVGLVGALVTPALDQSNSGFAWFVSFLFKWCHSPIITTLGLFVVLGAAIGGRKIDFRRGMIFVETGAGQNALTLGGICYAEKGLWTGDKVLDLLAQHESVHSRLVASAGELGFYVTYLVAGFWGAAQQGDWGGFFALNGSGCGNPLEKLAWSIRSGGGGITPQTSASSC